MMSAGLVALVGGIYAYIAAEQFYLDNPAMGICYAGYAVSNCGIYILLR